MDTLAAVQGPEAPRPASDSLDCLRRAARIAAAVLDRMVALVRAGVTTAELDKQMESAVQEMGGECAAIGYKGYPAASCISVNEEVCHGLPGERRLRAGDIVNLDLTVRVEGWHADTSRMYFVGEPSLPARRLCQMAHEAMWRGIRAIVPGRRLGVIGAAVEAHAVAHGCSVVREYCGHGIGRAFHQPPLVMHVGPAASGCIIERGMVFTVEPILNAGSAEVELASDGWTVRTRDRRLSAQFEHTVLVGPHGPEVLTMSPIGKHHPPW